MLSCGRISPCFIFLEGVIQTSVWRFLGGQFELGVRINLTLSDLSLKGVSERQVIFEDEHKREG